MAPEPKRGKRRGAPPESPHVNKEIKWSNIVKCLLNFQRGAVHANQVKNLSEYLVTEHLKNFYVWQIHSYFERRVTALNWHPNRLNFLVVGSKGGEMSFLNVNSEAKPSVTPGIGPGGSITSISFDQCNDDVMFTTSIDGTVKKWELEKLTFSTLLETNCFEKWYCSVNKSKETGLLVAGDNKGFLTVMGKDLKPVKTYRLHKSKVNTAEFCKARSWLLATASVDGTAKLWDVRNLTSPLHDLNHDKAVNSGLFSLTDSNRLLTTDQHSQLRVYKGPLWELETVIHHPHRQFQHLTAIRGGWHPLSDVIFIGRYPDPSHTDYKAGDPRTLDLFSAASGKLLARLNPPEVNNIVSLNAFNRTGDYLACGAGLHTPLWKCRFPLQRRKEEEKDDEDDDKRSAPKTRSRKNGKEVKIKTVKSLR